MEEGAKDVRHRTRDVAVLIPHHDRFLEFFFFCFIEINNMPASILKIGDLVDRIEDRDVTAATVIQIIERDDGNMIEISYEEGGSGWWPESALRPIESS